MKPCIIIPCFDHVATVGAVAQGARLHCPVIIVDDGSTKRLPELPECKIVRLQQNSGKGAALRHPTLREALRVGAIFGVIEGITPVIGWLLGRAASAYIADTFNSALTFRYHRASLTIEINKASEAR